MRGVEYKSPSQLVLMRQAGRVVCRALSEVAAAARPGVTTAELDGIAREVIAAAGATSSFLGYGAAWGYPPFPAVTCISTNDEVVHGIPGERELVDGDFVSVDFGVSLRGFHGDSAVSIEVGKVSPEVAQLSDVTWESLWAGVGAMRLGSRVGDISAAIEQLILARGDYGILREYTGHGIGSEMHQPPDVPNFGRAGKGLKIRPGLVLAIEPMVTLGGEATVTLDDEWTVVTRDGSWAAHWEHTVTATQHGLWVLTAEDGGEAELSARGLPFGPLCD